MSCDCNTLVVGEAGPQGPQGLAGSNGTNGTNGINAFTTVSASFTQPALNASVTFSVVENRWIALNQTIYISNAGFYRVTSLGGSPYSSVTAQLIKTDGVVNPSSVSSGLKVSPSSGATYTEPLSSLSVSGSSNLDGAVTVNTSKNNVNFIVKGDTADYLLVTKASSDRVGINIQNPAATLDVAGTLKVLSAAEFRSGATVNASQANSDFSVATQNSTNTLYVAASADKVGIGTSSPVKLLDVAGAAGINSLLVNPGGDATNPSFQVLGTGSTAPITVKSTSGPTFNGVGIFNSSPTVALDVTGETKVSGNVTVGSNVLKVDTSGAFVGINKATPTVALDVTGETKVSGNVTVGSNVLKVNSSGTFVGINKATPTVALDISGALAVSGSSALTTLNVSGDVSVASGMLQVDTANNKVGINDSTPSKTLDVNGTAGFTSNVNVGTVLYAKPGYGVGVNTEFPAAALDVTGATNISGNLTVATSGLIVNTTTQKVGINTTSPVTALDVTGITQSNSGFRIAGPGSSNATLTKFKYATGASSSIDPAANTNYSFTIGVTDAEVGDFVQVVYTSVPANNPTYTTLFGYVSSANVVTVVISNGTSTAVGTAQVYNVGVLVTKAIASS